MIQTKLLYFAVSALFGLLCAYTQQLMVYILYFLFIGWLLLMKKGSWKLAAFLLCTFFCSLFEEVMIIMGIARK